MDKKHKTSRFKFVAASLKKPKNPTSEREKILKFFLLIFQAQDRRSPEAYAGDIIGLHDGKYHIGDTFTEGENSIYGYP